MKYINYILLSLLFTLSWGCSKDEGTSLSKAVLASASSLSFDAKEADSKIITVYADADWVSECPDWVTVSPAQGNGTMDVTISVTDNMRDGATDNYNPQIEMFARFKMKSSFHKTKRII